MLLKKVRKAMYIIFIIIIAIFIAIGSYMQHPMFGKLPKGERLAKIEATENYIDGAFQNQSYTPDRPDGVTLWDVFYKYLFKKKIDLKPKEKIPSVKTELLNLESDREVLVWFGHSSYFLQIDKKRILVDPVLSGSASPIPFVANSFYGTDIYSVEDIPEIDFLLITHDHYDHLDYKTVKKIEPKVKTVICGLGMGAHFEYWGYDANKIIERNWNENIVIDDGFKIHFTPARHFSGRSIYRSKALWTSYVLETTDKNIYIGGDSGYDTQFKQIGETFGSIDLAILENGQYDEHWPYLHLLPDDVIKASKDLNAERVLPVHSSKFVLGNHPWYEPLELITINSEKENINVSTPMIGEIVDLNDKNQKFSKWWKDVE